jgi:TnpA family transposase
MLPADPSEEELARDFTLSEVEKVEVRQCRGTIIPAGSRFIRRLRRRRVRSRGVAAAYFHHRLGFSGLWGAGNISSSDGQRFGVQSSSLLASFYPRYFGYYERAITVYTHSFMPRLRDLADQQLYPEFAPEALRPLLRGGLDLSLLGEQWDQLVRVAASLRDRVASAHVVLQRLANASPADRVTKALTTLGRIVKTIYILRYIQESDLRGGQLQLNRASRTTPWHVGCSSPTVANSAPVTTRKS